MSIQVAPTRLADVASLHDCIDVVARDADFLAFYEAPSQEELARDLTACATNGSIHLVAKDAQQVVGWAQIDRAKGPLVAHRGDLGMGVLPSYRGRGIARQLLEQCISMANGRGIHRVELEARSDNRRALELYCSIGFAVESLVKGAMKVDDTYHDAFRMCLRIVPPSQATHDASARARRAC